MRNLLDIEPQGEEAFSEMPGARALSFHGFPVGETPGPGRSRGEQREEAELLHREAVEKTSPGAPVSKKRPRHPASNVLRLFGQQPVET